MDTYGGMRVVQHPAVPRGGCVISVDPSSPDALVMVFDRVDFAAWRDDYELRKLRHQIAVEIHEMEQKLIVAYACAEMDLRRVRRLS